MNDCSKNGSVPVSTQKVSKPSLNKPVNCPWTSSAPLTSSANHRIGTFPDRAKSSNDSYPLGREYDNGSNFNGFANRYTESHRASSAQFFHFLRLMQLFPDVHPATLHTVMTLCKNDFFSTVDKLLYAKRCKDLIVKKRQLLVPNNKGRTRYQPYPLKPNFNENIKIVLNCNKNEVTNSGQSTSNQETQTTWNTTFPCRSMDSKRLVYKNKSKVKQTKPEAAGTEYTPIRSPLSPSLITVENGTKLNNVKDEV